MSDVIDTGDERRDAAQARAIAERVDVPLFAGGSSARQIAPDTWWVGASDRRLALFENAYPLEHGMAYNSYLIMDEKVVLVDTVDRAVVGQFFENVLSVLGGRDIDYVVVNHMEPDHSAALGQVLDRWPHAQVVCTKLAAQFISQYFSPELRERCRIVAEGDALTSGRHALSFVEAPWVHWPEVMMSYDAATGVLFSADAFGTFGALDGNIFADQLDFMHDDNRLDEARRYYTNIVGKYGPYVQRVLAKAATLDGLTTVCATHGPIWRHPQDIAWIIDKYAHWAAYESEDQAVVIYCASVYGGTESAANMLAAKLSEAGVADVRVYDVSKTHMSYLVAEAFRASHLVFASVTYNNGVFTAMRDLIADLGDHHMHGRLVSFIENGTWHANSAKLMRAAVSAWPDMVEVGDAVALKSTVSEKSAEGIARLAGAIAASVRGDAEHACETRLSDPLPAAGATGAGSAESTLADAVSGASTH